MKVKHYNKCYIHDDFCGVTQYHCDPFMSWEMSLFRDNTPKTEAEMVDTTEEMAWEDYKRCSYYEQQSPGKFYCKHLETFPRKGKPDRFDNECRCDEARLDKLMYRTLEDL